jgi:hypothetical protein
MPPHLHPRSTATSTLFAGTLLASFVVVGIPHVFPCPRPRTGYAADSGQLQFDEDGKPIRRVRKRVKLAEGGTDDGGVGRLPSGSSSGNLSSTSTSRNSEAVPKAFAPQKILTRSQIEHDIELDEEIALFNELAAEAAMLEQKAKLARECPVPKPSGWVGRILGFEDGKREARGVVSVDGREKG